MNGTEQIKGMILSPQKVIESKDDHKHVQPLLHSCVQ
jgi:hypothetical protein